MPRLQNLFKHYGCVKQILSITTVEDVIMSEHRRFTLYVLNAITLMPYQYLVQSIKKQFTNRVIRTKIDVITTGKTTSGVKIVKIALISIGVPDTLR
jgi:hypothetical protein